MGSGLFSTLQNRLIIFRQNNTYIYTRYIGEYSQPTATAKLKFSDDELAGIKQKIIDLKLLNISNPVPNPGYYGSAGQVVGPCSNFYLKIQIGLDENELSFDDCNGAPDGRFGEFSNYIYQILQSKKEFMELPTPRLLYR